LAAVALHAPGQLSFDSVIALNEAATGAAFGWTPTFQSALLAWLGGGEVAVALHLGLMALAVAWSFDTLLGSDEPLGIGHSVLRWLLVANPLIWMFVGVVWRDVLLGVGVFAGTAALVLARRVLDRQVPWAQWSVVAACIAVTALARQHGMLLAAALLAALAVQIFALLRNRGAGRQRRVMIALIAALFPVALTLGAARLTDATIKPAREEVARMDGLRLVLLYDIAGMWAIGSSTASVRPAALPAPVAERFESAYSPERIDGVLAAEGVRDWVLEQPKSALLSIWWTLLKQSPTSYLDHRFSAARRLLGGGDVRRCLPGYWGVAGPPEMLAALGLHEAMDARDRWIGDVSAQVSRTPWLWNMSYVLILLSLVPGYWRRRASIPEQGILALAGLAYVATFVLAGVACDVRYLFPTAMIATALALDRLGAQPALGRDS
jgi:hypothetical protein